MLLRLAVLEVLSKFKKNTREHYRNRTFAGELNKTQSITCPSEFYTREVELVDWLVYRIAFASLHFETRILKTETMRAIKLFIVTTRSISKELLPSSEYTLITIHPAGKQTLYV